jgi:tetratricopeptide (TPR) repeat protein
MQNYLRHCWLTSIVLAALAAAPVLKPDDLVRKGNEAFDRGDYAAAAELYSRAEERTNDPGLVAFNEATALYQLGRYREAELHYGRCLEDAAGTRRDRLLYNLANSLVQQARNRNPRRLKDAIAVYERCLGQDGIEAELAADARHNLELARLLLQKARSSKESQNESSEDQGGNNSQPDEPRNDFRPGGDQSATPLSDAQGKAGPATNQGKDRNPAAAKSDQPPPPGKGNLPPIPDEDALTAMSPEDASEHLKKAAARILHERREHRERAVPASPASVLDW